MAERHINHRERALSLVQDRGIARARDFKAAGIPLIYLKRLTDDWRTAERLAGVFTRTPTRSAQDIAHDLAEAAAARSQRRDQPGQRPAPPRADHPAAARRLDDHPPQGPNTQGRRPAAGDRPRDRRRC